MLRTAGRSGTLWVPVPQCQRSPDEMRSGFPGSIHNTAAALHANTTHNRAPFMSTFRHRHRHLGPSSPVNIRRERAKAEGWWTNTSYIERHQRKLYSYTRRNHTKTYTTVPVQARSAQNTKPKGGAERQGEVGASCVIHIIIIVRRRTTNTHKHKRLQGQAE
ncbi:hypothetical protein GY45DRAFT_365210 [Cubamyces sp. BRFM 1775]|nr:hypothetical protein GY45DRAFT_365210 [Cubamyces sp. BRFM 1775]